MKKTLISLLAILLILSSCKLKEEETNPVTPTDPVVSIKVIKPNGGESIPEGSEYKIEWSGTGVALVKIQYTVDNGATWALVADSIKNTGSYIWFPVPNIISNQCRMRITSVDKRSSDESDQVFSIIKNTNESLRITAPIGGESWEAGSAKQIKWFSSGIDSVRIEYTSNGGNKWNLIAIDKRNTGVYYWEPVPNTPSTMAKVRIKDAKDGIPSAESPNTFTILPESMIKVLSPNGGEKLIFGKPVKIEWLSENIENVKIAYTTNNGFSWTTIVAAAPSIGYYIWTSVPNLNSKLCKIRIYDAFDGEPNDVSDNTFTISNLEDQSILVKSPNGGESWEAGTMKSITWFSVDVDSVIIEYTIDNGNKWVFIGRDKKNTGIFYWDPIPNIPSAMAKVRIKDAKDGIPFDESDAPFNILPEPNITVLSPNGAEMWLTGTNQKIKWISENIENVKIEYTTNNGQRWFTIEESIPSIGMYDWKNIPNHNSALCKVKISDAKDGQPSDVSNNVFTITNQLIKSITVISPNGGEEWQAGTSQNIIWTSTGIANVKIEFTTNNGLTWNIIQNNYANTGSFEWNVPNNASSQCKVRVSDAVDLVASDESNNTFTINPIQSITLISPNGNERIIAGESFNILWNSTGIKNVKIEYTVNNGILDIDWNVLVKSTPAAAGSFSTSFTEPSNLYRVRISDADDGSPMVASAGTFTVIPKPSIKVITPNGGENWLVGETFEIRWQSNSISNVKIELTINGGAVWRSIATNIPSNGIYNWKVDSTLIDFRSDLCKIKISDFDPLEPNKNRAVDESDGFFSIHPKTKLLRIKTPNGGEQWAYNAYQRIEWTSAGITSVKIEYTLDNGMSWQSISEKYPSTGAYDWNPPNIVSSLARIRITDVSANAGAIPLDDVSDSYFSLTAGSPFITIVKPDGETIYVDVAYNIIWNNSDEITSVNLEYSLDNGLTWTAIIGLLPLTPEKYQHVYSSWTPTAAARYARIRISGGGVTAISSVFEIQKKQ